MFILRQTKSSRNQDDKRSRRKHLLGMRNDMRAVLHSGRQNTVGRSAENPRHLLERRRETLRNCFANDIHSESIEALSNYSYVFTSLRQLRK